MTPGQQPMFPHACDEPGGAGNRTESYRLLNGPQVEPTAGAWTFLNPPRVVTIPEVLTLTANQASQYYIPPYPLDQTILDWEIAELVWLEQHRDDPTVVAGNFSGVQPFPAAMAGALPAAFADAEREQLSDFLQLDPPPFGAIYNISPQAGVGRPHHTIGNINQQHLRRDLVAAGAVAGPNQIAPVVVTGRQLARMFQDETPGLAHRNALNYLLYKRFKISPPRQARIWMALDVAIYSALVAAWFYKWLHPTVHANGVPTHRYRQRPYEYAQDTEFVYGPGTTKFRVLYDDFVDDHGLYDKCARTGFCPSPGSPRHPAYPSGHSTYSAAASEVLAYFFPGEAAQFRQLADNIGTARLWAGVHWRSDHIAGRLLGQAVGQLVIRQLQQNCIPVTDTDPDTPGPNDPVPSYADVVLMSLNAALPPCDADQDKMANQTSNPIPECGGPPRTQA